MRLSEVAKLAEPPTGPEAAKIQNQINRGKKRSKRLAEASGLLGLGALALRAPQAANAMARRSPRLAATRSVKRLGSLAPHATKWSEASVPLSIGTGAIGSFNYAHQIGRENKLAPPKKVVKADDKFLHKHRNYISESAERAYVDLGERRDRRQADRSAYLTLAGAGAGATINRAAPGATSHLQTKLMNATFLRKNPTKIPVPVVKRPTKLGLMVALPAAVGTVGLGRQAWERQGEAKALQERRNKIKTKAYERKAAGQYGRPAKLRKDHLDDVSKAMWKIPTPGLRRAVRPGGLMRMPTGKVVTRRGSIPGSGRLFT
jgi:hypothetical protein